MGAWVVFFVGGAVLYGTLSSLLLLGVWHLLRRWVGAAGSTQAPVWRFLPLVWVTLTFIALTLHPFPDPTTLSCPVASATPQLTPFQFYQTIRIQRWDSSTVSGWLTNFNLMATLMNFVVCLAIGWIFVRHQHGVWSTLLRAALFGALLTTAVELTQLTGIWGYYPCAYRQFDVDDLILNFLGVVSGAALKRQYFALKKQYFSG